MNHNIGISPLKFQVLLWCPVPDGFDQHIRAGFGFHLWMSTLAKGEIWIEAHPEPGYILPLPPSCQLRINSPCANPLCETSARSVEATRLRIVWAAHAL